MVYIPPNGPAVHAKPAGEFGHRPMYWSRTEACDPGSMLTQAEIDSFVANGYVAVRDALPADVAQACQDEIWSDSERGPR